MHPAHMILCPRCFRKLTPYQVRFKCPWHKTPLVFSPGENEDWLRREDYERAACPDDAFVCTRRVCPECGRELARYAGHTATEYVVGLAGARGSGKTLFMLALLQHLMRHGVDSGLVPMFEDDDGYRAFLDLYSPLVVSGQLPDMTLVTVGSADRDPPPMGVRLYEASRREDRPAALIAPPSLIFYDPPGELFESFTNTTFVRYLAHTDALILILDADWLRGEDGRGRPGLPTTSTHHPSHVLSTLAKSIRNEEGLAAAVRIPRRLAVVLAKGDVAVYPGHPALRPPTTADGGPVNGRHRRRYLDKVNRRAPELLGEWGFEHFATLAKQEFADADVHYFVSSTLHFPSGGDRPLLRPLGVLEPLLWTLGRLP